jgi:hypothetical protein
LKPGMSASLAAHHVTVPAGRGKTSVERSTVRRCGPNLERRSSIVR